MKCKIFVVAAVLGRALASPIVVPSLSDEWHIESRALGHISNFFQKPPSGSLSNTEDSASASKKVNELKTESGPDSLDFPNEPNTPKSSMKPESSTSPNTSPLPFLYHHFPHPHNELPKDPHVPSPDSPFPADIKGPSSPNDVDVDSPSTDPKPPGAAHGSFEPPIYKPEPHHMLPMHPHGFLKPGHESSVFPHGPLDHFLEHPDRPDEPLKSAHQPHPWFPNPHGHPDSQPPNSKPDTGAHHAPHVPTLSSHKTPLENHEYESIHVDSNGSPDGSAKPPFRHSESHPQGPPRGPLHASDESPKPAHHEPAEPARRPESPHHGTSPHRRPLNHPPPHPSNCPDRALAVAFHRTALPNSHKPPSVFGYFYEHEQTGTVALYSLFNARSGDFFYTDEEEEGRRGYETRGVVGYVLPKKVCGSTPLYRLFNYKKGVHYFTTSASEKAVAARSGYRNEGVVGYVYSKRWIPR